ncbi:hypothetical protein [Sphingomonas crocodyli]|uniref:O-antigen ligase domain-containing protein n=1 Tax=Sphingomonas crocodyli TaxID=1979270 RepID=A0A437M052_9SPHN|nr:hypothetical protein [Sphingomonas crocodyli]RVT91070.1 hypothetical protein EOD43_16205 [Sphingomonas crocodyli]
MSNGGALTADGSGYAFAEPAQASVARADAKASRLFVHITLILAIILQRFGILAGGGTSALFVAVPGLLALLAWIILSGRARLDSDLALYFLAFLGAVSISATVAFAFPDNRVALSLTSPIAVLINYGLFLVRPNERFDRTVVLDIFLFYVRLCAVLAIIQYLVQFVGLRFFAFGPTFPFLNPILVEQVFNFDPVVAWGSTTRRATGIFPLEPSILSQLLVLAAVIDFFLYRRMRWVPAYAVAYMFSYSGTGAISLLLALPPFVLLFHRQASRLVTLAIVGVGLLGVTAILLPEQFNSFTSRSGELSSKQSSGHARFVGQFEVLGVVIDEPRALIGYGPGALERATFFQRGTTGPISKLTIDYGMIGCLLFMVLILKAFWRWDMAILPLVVLMQFLTGGGYFVFTPLIAIYMLLSVWAVPPKEAEAPPSEATAAG